MPMTGSRRVALSRMSAALAAGRSLIRWSMFAASAGRTVSGIMVAASFSLGTPTMLDVIGAICLGTGIGILVVLAMMECADRWMEW